MNITQKIEAFNTGRNPDLLAIKYRAMSENSFRFFRGANHLFWEDLYSSDLDVTSPAAWICADLHLENFGSYRSDNRLVYFDLNDFDEAVLGHAHQEIMKLVCSIFVAFDSLDMDMLQAEKLSALCINCYAETLAKGKAVYLERQTAKGILKDFLRLSEERTQKNIIEKKTEAKKKKRAVLIDNEKHFRLDDNLKTELIAHMSEWLRHDEVSPYNYEIIDAAFRVAGTGSLGLNRYMFLLRSLNHTGSKHMIIDMKQAHEPFPQQYISLTQPAWQTPAHRIKAIGERMQNRPPALLSTTSFKDVHYIVQEMQPEKNNIDFKLLKHRYRDMCRVISDMGVLTASAQLRSSGREGAATADELIRFGKEADWKTAVIRYASGYAKRIKGYYNEFITHPPKEMSAVKKKKLYAK